MSALSPTSLPAPSMTNVPAAAMLQTCPFGSARGNIRSLAQARRSRPSCSRPDAQLAVADGSGRGFHVRVAPKCPRSGQPTLASVAPASSFPRGIASACLAARARETFRSQLPAACHGLDAQALLRCYRGAASQSWPRWPQMEANASGGDSPQVDKGHLRLLSMVRLRRPLTLVASTRLDPRHYSPRSPPYLTRGPRGFRLGQGSRSLSLLLARWLLPHLPPFGPVCVSVPVSLSPPPTLLLSLSLYLSISQAGRPSRQQCAFRVSRGALSRPAAARPASESLPGRLRASLTPTRLVGPAPWPPHGPATPPPASRHPSRRPRQPNRLPLPRRPPVHEAS